MTNTTKADTLAARLGAPRRGRHATTQASVLLTLESMGVPMLAREIAEMIGVSRYVVWCALYRLSDAGKVERVGLSYRYQLKSNCALADTLNAWAFQKDQTT